MSRVLVYGLDGVPLWLIKDAEEKGYIKNIPKLMNEGVYGNLIAIPPIHTPPNWNSAFTGVDPGVHGIVGFYYLDENYNIKYYSARDRRVDPVWVIASRYNKKCVIVNVPITYPPDEVNGFMISGDERYTPPTPSHVYPSSIYEYVKRSGYLIDIMLYDTPEKAIDLIYKVISKRSEVTRGLMSKINWDLTIVVFRSIDYVMHKFLGLDEIPGGNDEAKIRFSKYPYEVLSYLDEELDKFMGMLDDKDHIIIMSDHGHKPRKKVFNINIFLRDKGWLRLKKNVSEGGDKRLNIRRLRKNRFLRGIWYLLPNSIKYRFKKMLLKIVEVDTGINPNLIDWDNTRAVGYSIYGGIKLNVEGREEKGVIPADKYEDFVNKLLKLFREENEKRKMNNDVEIIRNIYSTKSLYRWFNLSQYPDLIAVLPDDAMFSTKLTSHEVISDIRSTIDFDKPLYQEPEVSAHIPEGIYIFNGPAFKNMGRGPDLNMMDIAPHILYLLNIPIPKYMQGRVNEKLFNEEWLIKNPIRYSYSRKFAIKSRLDILRDRIKKGSN